MEGIRASGKRVEHLVIQEIGGAARHAAQGILLAQEMVREASLAAAGAFPISELVMGMKCGSSDTTSGLVPNPAIGVASDLLVAAGGVSILGEVTEIHRGRTYFGPSCSERGGGAGYFQAGGHAWRSGPWR